MCWPTGIHPQAYECWQKLGFNKKTKIVKKYGLTPLQPEPGKKYVGVTSLKDAEAPPPKKPSPSKDGVGAHAPSKPSPASKPASACKPAAKTPPKKK